MLVKAAIIGCLLILFYQDIRYRAVYWILFPVLLALYLGSLYRQDLLSDALNTTLLNLAFLLIQFLLLSLYFFIRNRKWTNLTHHHLGWGDMLFLLTLAFYLSPLNYLLFYTISLLLVLVCSLILFGGRAGNARIPLAGLQALLLLLVLLAEWQTRLFSLQSDQWIINRISP